MKFSFFAATALLGLAAVKAIQLPQGYDHINYQLAEIDSNSEGDSHAEGETKGGVDAKTKAESEQINNGVNGGVTIRLNTPECAGEAAEPFENQMLKSLQDLSGKSMDLYEALKVLFAKNARLAAGTTYAVKADDSMTIKPFVEEEPPIVIKPTCPPEVKQVQSIKIGVDSDAAKPESK